MVDISLTVVAILKCARRGLVDLGQVQCATTSIRNVQYYSCTLYSITITGKTKFSVPRSSGASPVDHHSASRRFSKIR